MTVTSEGRVGRGAWRLASVVGLSLLFGVVVAVLKGGDAGVRDSLGNVSAPWLLLPYLAGSTGRGPWRGAFFGVLASMGALLGFYVAEAFVLDLGTHSLLTDLRLTVSAGRMYFEAGIVTGPVFGALGGLRVARRSLLTAVVVGFALIGEPLALFVWLGREGVTAEESGMIIHYAPLWIGEMVLGALLAAVIGLRLNLRGLTSSTQQ
jgi:hypothetical protein